jgi:hypothetical protein
METAIDHFASRAWTNEQMAKMILSFTPDEASSVYSPDIEQMAKQFHQAHLNMQRDLNESERLEVPQIGATISKEDQPSWMRSFNELSIRG